MKQILRDLGHAYVKFSIEMSVFHIVIHIMMGYSFACFFDNDVVEPMSIRKFAMFILVPVLFYVGWLIRIYKDYTFNKYRQK